MAPEQIEGGQVDARTDIFVSGCVLYEMLTGVASRIFAAELPGISLHDPLAIGVAAATLLVSALVAVVVPARRVAKTEPASMLRRV